MLLGAWLRTSAQAESPKAPHWAFQPVREPAIPAITNTAWCRTPIDRFIAASLESQGMRPSPQAEPRVLLRRIALDLTGLPPSADELESFAANPSAAALQRAIDRFLESPRYGEHWGRHWLDVVRYADTAGETADYPVPVAWRYRNYVIQSFNADKPYDQFLREQIAGDILARSGPRSRYAEQVTATGFLAISRRFGFDSENYHHLTLQDTIDTLGQSVMGLTLGCARCHAHKFDPISMPEYYALYGIFDSTRYAFPGSEQKQRLRALVPLIPPEESGPKWRAFETRVAALTARLEQLKSAVPSGTLRSLDDFDGDFELQAPAAGGSKGVLVPPWINDGPISVTTDAQSPFRNLHPGGRVGVQIPAGTNAYRMSQRLHPSVPQAPRTPWNVNLDFRISAAASGSSATPTGAHRFVLGSQAHPSILAFRIASDRISFETGSSERLIRTVPVGRWCNLQLRVDPASRTFSVAAGWPGDVVEVASIPIPGETSVRVGVQELALESVAAPGAGFPAVAFDNLAVTELPIPPVSTQASGLAEAAAAASQDAASIRRELERLLAEGPFELAYAVSEGTPHEARVQLRGEPDKPGDVVRRAFPAALGGGALEESEAGAGSGRLELANWLVDPRHPLTARVMVNRIWQYHFGQGLVRTPNDFGLRGQKPTHPELLDYLAARFVREGWSMKAMHRLILSSAVYQQASLSSGLVNPAQSRPVWEECPVDPAGAPILKREKAIAVEVDYSHFGRRRLGAEETRDAILHATGQLDATPGEGHPFPAPTGWGFTQHGPFSAVYDHSRRSVYLMAQRIQRHPFLALFDGADPNATTPGRRTTTVPTQALFFLNDPFVHACADRFAVRLLSDESDAQGRITQCYRSLLSRNPSPRESASAVVFLTEYGTEARSSGAAHPETAALAALVRVLIGSNEFLTVD